MAARDVVLEYSELMDEFGMDDSMTDLTPLTDITSEDVQRVTVATIDSYRQRAVIQTGPFDVEEISVGTLGEDGDGVPLIQVTICVDSTSVDLVEIDTGESVLTGDRDAVNFFEYGVVRQDESWLIRDVEAKPTQEC